MNPREFGRKCTRGFPRSPRYPYSAKYVAEVQRCRFVQFIARRDGGLQLRRAGLPSHFMPAERTDICLGPVLSFLCDCAVDHHPRSLDVQHSAQTKAYLTSSRLRLTLPRRCTPAHRLYLCGMSGKEPPFGPAAETTTCQPEDHPTVSFVSYWVGHRWIHVVPHRDDEDRKRDMGSV